MKPRINRVIDELRKMFPGKWTYDHQLHRWNFEEGWYVYAESALAPRYDGDDDSFITQYRRSDTMELLPMYGLATFGLKFDSR